MANQIPEDLFSFPFPEMVVPLPNTSSVALIDHGSKPYAAIDSDEPLPRNQSYLLLSNHVFAHNLLRFKSNQEQLRRMGLSDEMRFVRNSNRQYVWYNLCIPNMFRPSPVLQRLLSTYQRQFLPYRMIGVHVRIGGDHVRWHDKTSFMTKQGMNTIKSMLKRRIRLSLKEVRIFIASDCPSVLREFNASFPGRVMSIQDFPVEHVGMNSSPDGVIRCLLDLFLLSSCDELFLTKNSHFSMMAAHLALRRVPITILN